MNILNTPTSPAPENKTGKSTFKPSAELTPQQPPRAPGKRQEEKNQFLTFGHKHGIVGDHFLAIDLVVWTEVHCHAQGDGSQIQCVLHEVHDVPQICRVDQKPTLVDLLHLGPDECQHVHNYDPFRYVGRSATLKNLSETFKNHEQFQRCID